MQFCVPLAKGSHCSIPWPIVLDSDPLLKRRDIPLKPGDLVLFKSGWLATVGQDYEIWVRTATGLSRVPGKPVIVWEIACHS